MKCLTALESNSYLCERGLNFDGEEYAGFLQGAGSLSVPRAPSAAPRVESAGMQMTMPDSAAKQSQMLTAFFAAAPQATGWLIWLVEWGVWGEGYYDIWNVIRARFGETRSLKEAPSHLFGADEGPLARGMARLVLSFGWDAHLIAIPAALVVFMSHDDYLEVYTPRERALRAVAASLETLGLKKWK
jgi:hypothetical protein